MGRGQPDEHHFNVPVRSRGPGAPSVPTSAPASTSATTPVPVPKPTPTPSQALTPTIAAAPAPAPSPTLASTPDSSAAPTHDIAGSKRPREVVYSSTDGGSSPARRPIEEESSTDRPKASVTCVLATNQTVSLSVSLFRAPTKDGGKNLESSASVTHTVSRSL